MTYPNFRSRAFLVEHIRRILAFYEGRCIDRKLGGFFHCFRDDGTVYDTRTRHLVSSARFVFNFAMAAQFFGREEDRQLARHGLRFLREAHRDPGTGAYAWILDGRAPRDRTVHCYGHAFVVLAHAKALACGIGEAAAGLYETFDFMERVFWDSVDGLYADEADPDTLAIGSYRGQNANMHACEAMLAAYEATADARFLERARVIARHITIRQAERCGGLIWEHYDRSWQPDWEYNRADPKHLFRPWGYQAGHQTEWAKLLVLLAAHRDEPWMRQRAEALFRAAVARSWDEEFGGLCYGFAPDGRVCDDDKYFWVQAESLAAAALLAGATGNDDYWGWYDRIWGYAWDHMIDHRHGAWFRILSRDNRRYDDLKSPPGKTDYHTMGACYDVLRQRGCSA